MDRTGTSTFRNSIRQLIKRQRTSKSGQPGSVPSHPYSTLATPVISDPSFDPRSRRTPTSEAEDMHSTRSKGAAEGPKIPLLIRFFDPEVHAPDSHGRTLNEIIEHGDNWFEQCHNYVQMLFPLPEGSPFNLEAPAITRPVFEAFRARPELRAELRRAWVRMMQFYGLDVVEEVAEHGHSSSEATSEREAENEAEAGAEAGADVKSPEEPTQAQESDSVEHGDTVQPGGMALTETSIVHHGSASEATKTAPSKPIKLVLAPDYKKKFQNWVLRFDHNHLRITRVLRSLRVLGLQEECDAYFSMLVDVYEKYGRINERSLNYWKRAVERPLWIAPDDEKVLWLRAVCKEMEEAETAEMEANEMVRKQIRELTEKDRSVQDVEMAGRGVQHATVANSDEEPVQKPAVEELKDMLMEDAKQRGGSSKPTEDGKWNEVQRGGSSKWDTIGKTDADKDKWSRLGDSPTSN